MRLTPKEVLQRARVLVEEARAIEVPERGRARVGPLIRRRQRLKKAKGLLHRLLRPRSPLARRATRAQQEEARRLLAEVERLWPRARW